MKNLFPFSKDKSDLNVLALSPEIMEEDISVLASGGQTGTN